MVEVRVSMFGPLRKFGAQVVTLQDGATVAEARAALIAAVPDAQDLLAVSALATADRVLADADTLVSGEYAVLPPVSGG